MRQKLLVLFIIPVFAVGMIPITQITLAQQSTSSTDLINGLLTPRIDGLIDKTSSLTSLTEWGDAKFVDADFLLDQNSAASLDQEEEEPIQMRLFSKWVGNDFIFPSIFQKQV